MRVVRDFAILIIMVLLQVFLFNEFLFFRYLNPYLYIYPLFSLLPSYNRSSQLLIAFGMGAAVDILEGGGGVHTAATVFLAFAMPLLLRVFGTNRDDGQEGNIFQNLSLERKLSLLFIGFFLHHFLLFSLENFAADAWLSLFQRTVFSSLFSFIFVLLYQLWNARR